MNNDKRTKAVAKAITEIREKMVKLSLSMTQSERLQRDKTDKIAIFVKDAAKTHKVKESTLWMILNL